MKRGLLLILFIVVLSFEVSAQSSYCYIDTDCTTVANMPNPLTTYIPLGYVSLQGHYSDVASSPGFTNTYNLCCPDKYTLGPGPGAAWSYSRINPPLENGSGHVGIVGGGLSDTVDIGTGACSVRTSCNADETCMFNVSNETQSHVMDCYAKDNPSSNSFGLSMCCKISEICYDGIDNDLDTFIDCADQDCFGGIFGENPGAPQLCANVTAGYGTWMNTSGCVLGYNRTINQTIYDPLCIGQPPPPGTPYYCSFGERDNPVIQPEGACCTAGYHSYWNGTGWQCRESDECGISPLDRCKFDSFLNLSNWYDLVYDGDDTDWCNTQISDLYIAPEVDPYAGSTGCCLIEQHGEINYWLDEDNVKIWG